MNVLPLRQEGFSKAMLRYFMQINLQVGKAGTILQSLLDNSYHDHFDFAFVGRTIALA